LTDKTDQNAVRACQRGDGAAYSTLVRTYYRHIFAMCLGIVGNIHDAEDIAQDAMLKGFLEIGKLRRPDRFEPWILRIAKHLCLDLLRQRKKMKALTAESRMWLPDRKNDDHNLLETIARLPQKLRLPLTLFYLDQKDARSIAQKLRISHSGVYQRVRRARRRLHQLLTEGDNREP
jgi:RNA polymerase sigma-70 factor (ECF subfamily)